MVCYCSILESGLGGQLMAEPKCPLNGSPCMMAECAWWAGGVQKCLVVAVGMMVNNMHDMGVQAYQKMMEKAQEEEVTEV
jgi:hypothetical protein